MDEFEVNSVAEVLDAMRQATAELGNAHLWARGHAKSCWRLKPYAHRVDRELEAQRVMLFRTRAPAVHSSCPDRGDLASWLVLMQHHGLPTRLLDWSESVAVGLYFAVQHEPQSGDAALFLLSPGALNEVVTGTSLICDLSTPSLRSMIEAGSVVNRKECEDPLIAAVISSAIHSRAHMQQSAYTIHSSLAVPLDEPPDCDVYLRKLVIPQAALDRVRYDLRSLGINRSLLFPDLTNLAAELADMVVIRD